MAGVLTDKLKEEFRENMKKSKLLLEDGDEWLNRKAATVFLKSIGCPISTKRLANMAINNNAGGGPPYIRFRWNYVSYRKSDLLEWARQQTEWIK